MDNHIRSPFSFPVVVSCCLLLSCLIWPPPPTLAVISSRSSSLSKQQFLQLDEEVLNYYLQDYDHYERQNFTYDQLLYRSIRSVRHTVVLELFDYRYTSEQIMKDSMGPQVNRELCNYQLGALYELARLKQKGGHQTEAFELPLSIVNFLESSGKTGAGVLNGNFVWLGSYASCVRAKISGKTLARYRQSGDPATSTNNLEDLRGRYCVAHLRAKSWPRRDDYFDDRITIRKGLCLPESCHSYLYRRDARLQRMVDYLARHDLLEPFANDSRYETADLYCLPDEESPHRRLDLGAQLLCLFVALWLAVSLYANYRYNQRATALKLLEEADIRTTATMGESSTMGPDPVESATILGAPKEAALSGREACWANKRSNRWKLAGAHAKPFDLIEAFSIECNLNHLFAPRQDASSSSASTPEVNIGTAASKPPSSDRQQQQQATKTGETTTTTTTTTSTTATATSKPSKRPLRRQRVNIDIFDGIKVIATAYIIHGHTLMFFFGSVTDMRFAHERMLDFTMIATINTLQVVSLFYIITGCLLTYLALTRARAKQLASAWFWLLVLAGRYLRLLPSYLLVWWFARHLAPAAGLGPHFQEYRTDGEHPRGFCGRESWRVMWTMSAADVKIPYDCLPQTWYLSNDFRTLLVLPLYVCLLARSARAGYAAILATMWVSVWRLVGTLQAANIDYRLLLHWKPHVYSLMADRLHDVYTDFGVRISTYLLGVALGHLLYLYELGHIRDWPPVVRKHGNKLALLVGSTFFCGAQLLASPQVNQFLPARDAINPNLVVLLVPLFKVAMELCMCTCSLLLLTGGGFSWCRDLLGSRAMKILSNISYAVFLVHVEIMYKVPTVQLESNYWHYFVFSCFFIVSSHLVALAIYLLYEMPINNILRHLFKLATGGRGSGTGGSGSECSGKLHSRRDE